MANEPALTIIGNLTSDPQVRFTRNGKAVASFTIASTPRSYNKDMRAWEDGNPVFMRCSAWGKQAENIPESLHKGVRVIATGVLTANPYTDKNGNQRDGIELRVEEIGPSLTFAATTVNRPGGGSNFAQPQQQASAPDPWSQPAMEEKAPF